MRSGTRTSTRRTLAVLHPVFALTGLIHASGGPLLPSLVSTFQLNDSQSGLLFFLYYSGTSLGALFAEAAMSEQWFWDLQRFRSAVARRGNFGSHRHAARGHARHSRNAVADVSGVAGLSTDRYCRLILSHARFTAAAARAPPLRTPRLSDERSARWLSGTAPDWHTECQ
jgi:hypothetical protein